MNTMGDDIVSMPVVCTVAGKRDAEDTVLRIAMRGVRGVFESTGKVKPLCFLVPSRTAEMLKIKALPPHPIVTVNSKFSADDYMLNHHMFTAFIRNLCEATAATELVFCQEVWHIGDRCVAHYTKPGMSRKDVRAAMPESLSKAAHIEECVVIHHEVRLHPTQRHRAFIDTTDGKRVLRAFVVDATTKPISTRYLSIGDA